MSRWLVAHGFEPVIFEQADELGGQWTAQPGLSGIWPTMHTNTSRVLTAFSDLEPEGMPSTRLPERCWPTCGVTRRPST